MTTRAENIYSKLRAAADTIEADRRRGQLHAGVRGAHSSSGGMETPQADLDADDRRFGAEATFMDGPDGRLSMNAGDLKWKEAKPHVDTEPYERRPAAQGTQLPLGTTGAFQPHDPIQHFVRLKHPHLAEDYHFEHTGDDYGGHQIDVFHHGVYKGSGGPMTGKGRAGVATDRAVGFLRWNGSHERGNIDDHDGEAAIPGEIQGVSVHPDHRGKGISTALWDYAQAKVALHGVQEPIHSKTRSTAGNHWAHFVGGKAMARQEGHDEAEYFTGEWR